MSDLTQEEASTAWMVADAMLVAVEEDFHRGGKGVTGAINLEAMIALAVSVAKDCRAGAIPRAKAVKLGAFAMRIAMGEAITSDEKQEKVEAA
jgi:hypothetical protein